MIYAHNEGNTVHVSVHCFNVLGLNQNKNQVSK